MLTSVPDLYESEDDAKSIIQDFREGNVIHTENGSFQVKEFEVVEVKMQIISKQKKVYPKL